MITVKNLHINLGGQEILKDLSFHVEPGSIFGLVGPSGAGKSTLFRCLIGLIPPRSGQIHGLGNLGIVFQNSPLLSSKTVQENVFLPLKIGGSNVKRFDILQEIGIEHLKDRYPAELSGGQKQKVCLARALVTDPSILFLDEPSSALDPQSTRELQELLLKFNRQGKTIIIITHDMDLIRALCTKVAVLNQGQIVEMKSAVDLFSHPEHPITKQLLEEVHHPLPETLKGEKLRLYFCGAAAKEPIISRMIREYEVEVNILKGSIDLVQSEIVGELTVTLRGPDYEKAIAFLNNNGVRLERLT